MRLHTLGMIVARLFFVALIGFEVLNWIGVLHFDLDFTWLGLVLTAGAVWAGLEAANWHVVRKSGQPIGSWVFMIAAVSTAVDAFGDIHGWYAKYIWYDQFAHMTGGMSAGAFVAYVFWRSEVYRKLHLPNSLYFTVTWCMGIALGVTYEMEEYLEDVFTGSRRLGDGPDTANDLLLDITGALLAVLIVLAIREYKKHVQRPMRQSRLAHK